MRVCYDAVTTTACPDGAPLYLGYSDGQWPNANAMAALHPTARVVTVTTNPAHRYGDMLDVENGDASPSDVVPWLVARRAAGAWPSIYCGLSNWIACQQPVWAAHIVEPPWFVAHYTNVEHIEPGAVGTQWTTGDYDTSAVADFWPGVDPDPTVDLLEDAPMAVFASDADARAYLVRVFYNRELGREPSAIEQANWSTYIIAHGVDQCLAGVRDSGEAVAWRKNHGL